MPTPPPFTDVEFEVVDHGHDGYHEPADVRTLGAIPAPLVALLARLASGALRGHEADALGAALILGGYARSEAGVRAAVQQGGQQINFLIQQIDLEKVLNVALEPERASAVQPVPLLGLGLLGGVLLGRLFSSHPDSADADDEDDD